jgi:hypothetical protein
MRLRVGGGLWVSAYFLSLLSNFRPRMEYRSRVGADLRELCNRTDSILEEL